MNAKKLEQWLLLEQSGELPEKKMRQLERELASSEEARRLRDELDLLSRASLSLDTELPAWTVVKIAARLRDERRPVQIGMRVLKPLVVLAACLLLAAGLFNFHEQQTSSTPAVAVAALSGVDVWSDPFDEELSNLESLLAAASGDPLDIMEM